MQPDRAPARSVAAEQPTCPWWRSRRRAGAARRGPAAPIARRSRVRSRGQRDQGVGGRARGRRAGRRAGCGPRGGGCAGRARCRPRACRVDGEPPRRPAGRSGDQASKPNWRWKTSKSAAAIQSGSSITGGHQACCAERRGSSGSRVGQALHPVGVLGRDVVHVDVVGRDGGHQDAALEPRWGVLVPSGSSDRSVRSAADPATSGVRSTSPRVSNSASQPPMGHRPQRSAKIAPLRRMSSRCCTGGLLGGVVLVVGAGVAHPAERATRVLPRVGEVGVLRAVPGVPLAEAADGRPGGGVHRERQGPEVVGLPPTQCVPRAGDGRAGCGSSSASRSVGVTVAGRRRQVGGGAGPQDVGTFADDRGRHRRWPTRPGSRRPGRPARRRRARGPS